MWHWTEPDALVKGSAELRILLWRELRQRLCGVPTFDMRQRFGRHSQEFF